MNKTQKQILILVDKKDKELGFADKEKSHKGLGLMHRAFMVFFLNSHGEILLTRRSKKKQLWPGFWDASVASHVLKGENYKQAAVRRIAEELDSKVNQTDLKEIGGFSYRCEFNHRGCENEYCQILVSKLKNSVKPDPEEIAEIKFENRMNITKDLSTSPEYFTPWFKIGYRFYLGSVAK